MSGYRLNISLSDISCHERLLSRDGLHCRRLPFWPIVLLHAW